MGKRRIISSAADRNIESAIIQIRDFTFSDNVTSYPVSESGIVLDGMSVLICKKGEYEVLAGDRKYCLTGGSVLILMPYRNIRPVCHSADCDITGFFLGLDYYLKNNASGIDYNIIMQLKEHPVVSFTPDQMKRLADLYSVIKDRVTFRGNPYSETCIKSLIGAFMAEIKSVCELKSPESDIVPMTRKESITDDFFHILLANYTSERSVCFYAEKMCLAPKYLSTVVKQVSGHTILEWINEVVLNRIKCMLSTTDMTVLQISQELNYSNPSFFGKFFKRYTGMTPMQYRTGR